jgi:plasmid stabilization system protein ParE
MAEVKWTKPALDDLEGITEYISRDSKVYAERFAIRVIDPLSV